MSGIFSGTIAAGLLATVAMVAAGHAGRPAGSEAIASDGQTYRLQFSGGAYSCQVERAMLDMRGSAAVTIEPGCESLYPRLSDARTWSESPDGTVALTTGDGAVLIEFAVADGVAYQSFQPGTPLASLIALN